VTGIGVREKGSKTLPEKGWSRGTSRAAKKPCLRGNWPGRVLTKNVPPGPEEKGAPVTLQKSLASLTVVASWSAKRVGWGIFR